jgi:hypothetical protein
MKDYLYASHEDRCAKGCHDIKGQPVRKLVWLKGEDGADDGVRYRWNKIGSYKSSEATCKWCGYNVEFIGI